MSVGYKQIKDQIVAILQGIASLHAVFGKEEKVLEKYPSACVSAKEHTADYNSVGDSGSNRREYQHYIRLYFRTDEKNDPDYEDKLEEVADEVIQTLESNITLNGTCQYSLPMSGVWRYGEKESPVRVFEIVMTSTVFVRRDNGLMS